MPFDDREELFCLVDKDDKLIGPIPRKKANFDKGLIHRSVGIIIIDEQDQILLQQRSKNKDLYPLFWTISASGHVTYGQTYRQSALRELREELGILLPLKFVGKFFVPLPTENEYTAIYFGKYTGEIFNLDKDEVDDVQWVKKQKLNRLLKKLTPYSKYILKELNLVK